MGGTQAGGGGFCDGRGGYICFHLVGKTYLVDLDFSDVKAGLWCRGCWRWGWGGQRLS